MVLKLFWPKGTTRNILNFHPAQFILMTLFTIFAYTWQHWLRACSAPAARLLGTPRPAVRAPTLRTPILRTGLCNRKSQLASQLYLSYWVKLKLHLCMKVPSIRPSVRPSSIPANSCTQCRRGSSGVYPSCHGTTAGYTQVACSMNVPFIYLFIKARFSTH